jgi:uncharacterized repeat protein (TIGR03803 family)
MRGKSFWIASSCSAAIFLLTIVPMASARNNFKTIHRFAGGKDGERPTAPLISDAAGNLYGTSGGGVFAAGTVFKLTQKANGSWSKMVLHSFAGGDGENPSAGLIRDAAGNLFGTTEGGGAYGDGTVFKLSLNKNGSWSETVLYSFSGQDGVNPSAGVTPGSARELYGTTLAGGLYNSGVAFQITPKADGTWSETVLHSFGGSSGDGTAPRVGLIRDAAGNLFGATYAGGDGPDGGTVFELTMNKDGSWSETVLHSFQGDDGAQPWSGLIFDDNGNLYGTTEFGGAFNTGIVFKLTPDGNGGWKERVLHSFRADGTDGVYPTGNLLFDKAGNLYGTTYNGGAFVFGTIFRLTPRGEIIVHAFKNQPGGYPFQSGLVMGPQGSLFGTTYGDGNSTLGSIFDLTP